MTDTQTAHCAEKPSKSHHLDKRAQDILAALEGRDSQGLLTTKELAALLKVSTQWCEGARHTGEGPNWIAIGNSARPIIRYRICEVREWLDSRVRAHTSQYTRRPSESSSSEG